MESTPAILDTCLCAGRGRAKRHIPAEWPNLGKRQPQFMWVFSALSAEDLLKTVFMIHEDPPYRVNKIAASKVGPTVPSLHVPENPTSTKMVADIRANTVIVCSIATVLIAAIVVILRLFTKSKILHFVGREDWCILAALVSSPPHLEIGRH